VTPDALVCLANLGRPRRPARSRTRLAEPVLADPAAATRQLGPLIPGAVAEADLPSLRRVQQLAVQAVEALLAGRPPDCAAISLAARASTAHVELIVAGATLGQRLVWRDASPASGLARRLIEELAVLDPRRLRSCVRTECGLLFYDTTRSRTRRWHAEDPCGWRERQHRRRARR
jgi:predicted RNA-binding Zn ribbon-like protein